MGLRKSPPNAPRVEEHGEGWAYFFSESFSASVGLFSRK